MCRASERDKINSPCHLRSPSPPNFPSDSSNSKVKSINDHFDSILMNPVFDLFKTLTNLFSPMSEHFVYVDFALRSFLNKVFLCASMESISDFRDLNVDQPTLLYIIYRFSSNFFFIRYKRFLSKITI
jgi:hypothetical protein